MSRRLRAAGRLVKFSVDFFQDLSASIVQAAGGRNRFMSRPMQSTNNVGGNPRAGYMQMMYDIPDGVALIVETRCAQGALLESARGRSLVADHGLRSPSFLSERSPGPD